MIGSLFSRERAIRTFVLICIILTTLPVMLFFDVSLFLKHYQVSSVVFLIGAVAVSCAIWLPEVVRWRGIVPLVVTILVLTNTYMFWSRYGAKVRADRDATNFRGLAVGDVISRYTPVDSGILVFGLYPGIDGQCLEIPYLSQRKGLTVPDYKEELVGDDPAAFLGGKELGAMVFCATKDKERTKRYNRWIERYSTSPEPRLFRVFGCYVWLPATPVVTLTAGNIVFPTKFLK